MPGGQICLICNCFQVFVIFQVINYMLPKNLKVIFKCILWSDHCHDMQILSSKILDKTFYYEIWALLLNFVWICFDCFSVRVYCMLFIQVKTEWVTCPHLVLFVALFLQGTRFDSYRAYKASYWAVAFDYNID